MKFKTVWPFDGKSLQYARGGIGKGGVGREGVGVGGVVQAHKHKQRTAPRDKRRI